MALLSTDMIREIQGIADVYVERERERVSRAAATEQDRTSAVTRDRRPRSRNEVGA